MLEKREQKYTVMIISDNGSFLRWYQEPNGKTLFTSNELPVIREKLDNDNISFTIQKFYFNL